MYIFGKYNKMEIVVNTKERLIFEYSSVMKDKQILSRFIK